MGVGVDQSRCCRKAVQVDDPRPFARARANLCVRADRDDAACMDREGFRDGIAAIFAAYSDSRPSA